MSRATAPTTAQRGAPPHTSYRRGVLPANYESVRSPYQQRKTEFPPNYRRDRPPGPLPYSFNNHRPNFIVHLRADNRSFKKADVEGLIAKCRRKPDNFNVCESGSLAGTLFFQQWTHALETMVHWWETRLDGAHSLSPRLTQNVVVPSDRLELSDRLKKLFAERVKGFIEGDLVQKWQKKLALVADEIASVSALLAKPNSVLVFNELSKKKGGLISESDLIARRIKEFKSAMKCMLAHLEGKLLEDCGDEGVEVFRFGSDFEWDRIYWLMMRECRRLDDGLPIYACRQDILRQIHCQQELEIRRTIGSGKAHGGLYLLGTDSLDNEPKQIFQAESTHFLQDLH